MLKQLQDAEVGVEHFKITKVCSACWSILLNSSQNIINWLSLFLGKKQNFVNKFALTCFSDWPFLLQVNRIDVTKQIDLLRHKVSQTESENEVTVFSFSLSFVC